MITQSLLLTHPLVNCLNRLTDKSPRARQRLQAHRHKTVLFRVDSLADLYVTITPEDYFATASSGVKVAVILDISASLVPRIAAGDSSVFDEIVISGDPDLAGTLLHLGKIFQADVEENLSSLIGDVLARRVTATGQELVRWHLDGLHNLSHALGEFLAEERNVATGRARFQLLASDIELLQQQLSQLEGRVSALIPSFSLIAGNLPRAGR
ncbi:hypothetical protein [Nitrosomonas sp.]|uniref:hypothetical protein n=1 Tax=Nitrosomonas sp. TaxID=42353 RepID=UPI0026380C00|nr:hypothetical protein [Nitrosomonas sp.]